MAQTIRYKRIELDGSGGTISIDVTEDFQAYLFYGTGTMAANYNITHTGVVDSPISIKIYYAAQLNLNGNTFTMFGYKLSEQIVNKAPFMAEALWDFGTSSFNVSINESATIDPQTNRFSESTTIPGGGGTKTLLPYQNGQWQELVGTGALSGNYTVNTVGDQPDGLMYFIQYNATMNIGVNTITIFGHVLDTDEASLGNSMVVAYYKLGVGWKVQHLLGGYTNLSYEFESVTVSFEATEQCKNRVYIPYNFRIEQVNTIVTKALAGSNDGTVVVSINGSATTPSTITVPASSALDHENSLAITSTNTGAAGSYIDFTTAKTTAGGKLLLTMKLKRTA